MQSSPFPFTGRILSVDQFRGYTIAGMIFVNFLGGFASISEWFKHHSDWMSYADTIAPIFVFVAGMGFRLSVLRHEAKEGRMKALLSGARKYAVLFIVGAVFYGPLDWHSWTDALVDIACSGFLALPFMYSGVRVRVGMAFVYMVIYQYLFTYAGYGEYTMAAFPNGGPLAPLSWVFCFLLGTVLYDLVATRDTRKIIIGCILWGLVLSAIGWGLRAEWPGIKEFWCFSQRSMTAPYPIYATGLAFLTYLPFYLLCDLGKIEIPTLTAVGANPLVMYMLHFFYMDAHGSIVARESSATIAVLAFCGFYLMCYIVAAYLYRNKYIVKIG